ncbi:hypothetical protein, partial [Morganella morganii]
TPGSQYLIPILKFFPFQKHDQIGIFTTPKLCAIVNMHQQNLVPGLEPRRILTAHNRVSGFFMHEAQTHLFNGGLGGATER